MRKFNKILYVVILALCGTLQNSNAMKDKEAEHEKKPHLSKNIVNYSHNNKEKDITRQKSVEIPTTPKYKKKSNNTLKKSKSWYTEPNDTKSTAKGIFSFIGKGLQKSVNSLNFFGFPTISNGSSSEDKN